MIRAKFVCESTLQVSDGQGSVASETVTFHAVTKDGLDNKQWSKFTPSGKIEMMITNPDAMNKFKAGHSYYIDFTPAD